MDENCQIVSFGRFELNPSENQSEPVWGDLPVIATRNLVLFPHVTIPIALIRNNARKVAKYAADNHISIGICCQLDPADEHPDSVKKVFSHGVIADVIQVIDLPGGAQTALVRARDKFKILGEAPGNTIPESDLNVTAKPVADRLSSSPDKEFDVLIKSIREACASVVGNSEGGQGLLMTIEHMDEAAELVNTIATNLPLDPRDKMKMLAINLVKQRAFKLFQSMQALLDSVEIANNIKERAREEMNQQSRNAFLQQQMNAIREELYGEEGEEVEKLRRKASQLNLPENAAKTVDKEIDKLARLNPSIPDYSTLLSYLETVLDLPWNVTTPLNEDFAVAEEVLNNDHYGLEKVKDRILEQLAVLMNNPNGKAPILCLVGAPGVGKTSLGQSVARALGRNYQRVSLGGLHDEAEIRGHRRTYIGAMPGRIIESLRRAKSSNPVILLDEVDKIGSDFKGDPSAALLEVLDPEQNCHFHDNYIDVDFDLSDVLFIATANTLSTIARPLLDRMEIIDISGYLLEEKIEIARRHLIPRILKEDALAEGDLMVSDAALRHIISDYTAESGVRALEKKLAAVARKAVLAKMKNDEFPNPVEPENLYSLLGLSPYKHDNYEGNEIAGVVTGLAWTEVGGEILLAESSLCAAKSPSLVLTGKLGDVMKESATIAYQWVKAHAQQLGINPELFDKYTLHVHFPEGAVPKDGPSAGITIVTSIVSTFLQKRVAPRLAMTGEITLRGRVLPVGGIREKILAAKRAGITDIVMSKENKRDIDDMPSQYSEGLKFHYVDTIDEVLQVAVLDEPVANPITL